jgi:hypothetical protein
MVGLPRSRRFHSPGEISWGNGARRPRVYAALDWENLFLSSGEKGETRLGRDELRHLTDWLMESTDVVESVAYVDSSTSASSKNHLDALGHRIVNVISRRAIQENPNGCLIKNAVDVEMVLSIFEAAVEIADLDAVVLLSGDGDFIPLVKRVKKRGLKVVIVGCKEHVNRSLANLANAVFYLEDILQTNESSPNPKDALGKVDVSMQNDTPMCLTPKVQSQINEALENWIMIGEDKRIPLAKALEIIWQYSGLKRLSDIGIKKAKELETCYPQMLKGFCIKGDQLCAQFGAFFSLPGARGGAA